MQIGDNPVRSSIDELQSDEEMTPNWTFTEYVPETQSTVDIQVSLFDRDVLSVDDIIDIDPTSGDNVLDLTFDLNSNEWTGDIAWPNTSAEGNGDTHRANAFVNVKIYAAPRAGGNLGNLFTHAQ